jgi:type III restriction enzyme|tara:strand:- start:6042 stop:6317 length:276 start_codon:yes stop_codon:yes gene_type:complete
MDSPCVNTVVVNMCVIPIPAQAGITGFESPAAVVKTSKGDFLNFCIIETKNVDGKDSLRKEERKIEHTKVLFGQISKEVKADVKKHSLLMI